VSAADQLAQRQIRTDVEMSVAARDGQIHFLFSERDQAGELRPTLTQNFMCGASDALTLSSLIADLAFQEDASLRIPNAQKEELVQRHRATLMDRITVMLNSQREKKTISNRSLARALVDVMSKEVFQ
jgi:hypothetical protein